MTLDRMRVGEITGLLAHVAGILDALPLDAYAEAIEANASSVASEHYNGSLESVAGGFRRARRTELVAAATNAREFATAMAAAAAHTRAARRADQLEQASAAEAATQATPDSVRGSVVAFNDAHAAAVRRAYPGADVTVMRRREEGLADDDPEAG
jgi:hypothetical protein